MTHSTSGQPPHTANASQQARGRGRWLTAISAAVGGLVLTASAVWLPIMDSVAHLLRPPELSAFPAYRGDVTPFQQAALTRVTAIVIASFLAIMALAVLAILLGRRVRRRTGNEVTLARLEKWCAICLIVSLLGLGIFVLWSLSSLPVIVSLRLRLPPSINQLLDIVLYRSPAAIIYALVGITAASAMGCFILSGIIARRGQRWRTPISLVVSALILLLWFATTAWVARFIVGFYLHLAW